MLGDKPDGGIMWGNLGADSPDQAEDQIAGFAEKAARAGVRKAVVKVRARGTSTAKDGRKVEIRGIDRDGALTRAQADRLRAILGKSALAPDVDVVLGFG
jgi:hypothetical protein